MGQLRGRRFTSSLLSMRTILSSFTCTHCFTEQSFAIPSSANFISILSSVILFMTWCHDPFEMCLLLLLLLFSRSCYISFVRSFPRHLNGKYAWQATLYFLVQDFYKEKCNGNGNGNQSLKDDLFSSQNLWDGLYAVFPTDVFMYTMLSLRT